MESNLSACKLTKHYVIVAQSISDDVILRILKMRTAFHYLALFSRLLMTILMALASAERSFSITKRVKTYLRLKTAQ